MKLPYSQLAALNSQLTTHSLHLSALNSQAHILNCPLMVTLAIHTEICKLIECSFTLIGHSLTPHYLKVVSMNVKFEKEAIKVSELGLRLGLDLELCLS